MKTKDLVLMAMFVALYAVLEYLKVAFNFFSMPQGGSVSLAAVPLLLAGYFLGFRKGLLVTVVSVLVGFMIEPPYILHYAQVFLDYFLGYAAYSLAVLIPNIKVSKISLPVGTVVSDFVRFMASNLSGWIFFRSAYEGNVIWGVMGYNATYMIPVMIVNFVFVFILLPRLKPLIK